MDKSLSLTATWHRHDVICEMCVWERDRGPTVLSENQMQTASLVDAHNFYIECDGLNAAVELYKDMVLTVGTRSTIKRSRRMMAGT